MTDTPLPKRRLLKRAVHILLEYVEIYLVDVMNTRSIIYYIFYLCTMLFLICYFLFQGNDTALCSSANDNGTTASEDIN